MSKSASECWMTPQLLANEAQQILVSPTGSHITAYLLCTTTSEKLEHPLGVILDIADLRRELVGNVTGFATVIFCSTFGRTSANWTSVEVSTAA